MAQQWINNDFITAKVHMGPREFFPFDGYTSIKILEQDYMQLRDYFTPLALNTPHPDDPTLYLVEETPRANLGGGVLKWTRVYANIPTQRSEPGGTYVYTFPGFWGYWQTFGTEVVAESTGRNQLSLTVPSRLQFDYYLVGDGGSYAAFTDIPIVEAQKYHLSGNETILVEYLFDSPPFVTASDPTATAYKALIAADTEIAVEDSVVSRWKGNIFERVTRYVVAR